ncbi:MAG TPA: GNAT family N-acetyltransferase [Brumimicrobium sp.]|nr:GNAT family N-acetyltransferase [Brumimicrobium sp.]
MNRTLIHSTRDKYFNEAWDLYIKAFHIDERREIESQNQIMKSEYYHFEVITLNQQLIGFIAWWELDQLIFIEHFATLDQHRGKGYGKLILNEFIEQFKGLIILEVEFPNTSINQRRIGFYERLGFELNTHQYQQLSLRKGGPKVDLLVMSYPTKIEESELKKFEMEFTRHNFSF